MIKKVIEIKKELECEDMVNLSWFDMQKPNLTAVSQKGIEFIIKAKFTHLHENDILQCEDGYNIQVKRCEDEIYELKFVNSLDFAKTAYEIGNRHQPICIEEHKITVLCDISLHDIVEKCFEDKNILVNKTQGYFKPNGKAHHSH
jgi:urease accessory protein